MQKTLKTGGLGEGDDAIETAQKVKNVAAIKNDGFFQFIKQGGQPESLNTAEFPLHKVTVEDVYLVYQKVLRFFGVFSLLQFKEKVAYCKATPAAWIILFQDKIHAVTRERPEGPLIVQGYADPTAMTIAGLDANRGFQKHTGTNASTSLFIEVMTDFAQTLLGNPSMWQSRLSGPAIAIELERRKGKQIRRRKAQ